MGRRQVRHSMSQWVINIIQVPVTSSRILDSKKSGEPSRRVESGLGVLDNNSVNLLMAFLMSVGGMVVASFVWEIPVRSIYSR